MKTFKRALISAITTILEAAAFGVCVVGAVSWFKLAMHDG